MRAIEFFAIHVTFSVLHSALSYYTAYSFIFTIEKYCVPGEPDCHIIGINYITWSILAMVLLFIEMVVYLAYLKDVIFGTITLFNFVGMFMYLNTDTPENPIPSYFSSES